MSDADRNQGIVPLSPEMADTADGSKHSHHSLVGRLRNYFLTGLILVGPIYITISLTWWFINWVDGIVRPFIPIDLRPETYLPVKIPGWGLLVALVALTLLGFLTANFVGRKLVEASENILNRMPVVRPLYKSLKQIFETLFSKSGSSFRRCGLVEFPSPGMWSLVFLSQPREPGHRVAVARDRAHRRLHAVHAQSDHRVLLLRAAALCHRPRHIGRAGDDAGDVGWHRAAGRRQWRSAEKARGARRDRARRAGGAAADGAGEIAVIFFAPSA